MNTDLTNENVSSVAVPPEPQQTSQPKPTRITITIPTNAYFISGIRDFTLELTKNMTGFSEQWAFRFQALVDELCNNAIEHGSNDQEDVKITFNSVHKSYIEISVEDTGTGPYKKTSQDLKEIVETRRREYQENPMANPTIRGRGLPLIVANWCDELVFEDIEGGGICVRVRKVLKAEDNIVSEANVYKL